MNILSILVASLMAFGSIFSPQFGVTILTTALTDTINTFRTNVNTSLTNLNTEIAGFSAFTGDSNFTWSSSTQNLVVSTTTIGLIAFEPDIDQTITTSTATVISSRTHIDLTMNGDFLLTSTPSITAGIDGQMLILHSQETTSTLDFQDDSVLAGSDIFLNGASGTLKPASSMMLIYQASAPIGWTILSNPNTAALGGDASLLSVRNVSGGSIAAGQVVHIDGFNVGLGRPTIVLADADVPALMPAIGITATAIANGQNGQVILSGNAIGLIDTSGASVGDGVWVSTTAGGVVFVRPTTDEIQRLGEVTRSHVTGNIIIHGAGRANDVPKNFTFTTGTSTTFSITSLFHFGGSVIDKLTGRSLSVDGNNDLVADPELYTESTGFAIPNASSTVYNGAMQKTFFLASTITEITCSTNGADITIGTDERSASTPNSAGTDIFNGGTLVCDSDGASTSTFANAGIAAGAILNVDIDATANGTTTLRFAVKYTTND